MFNFALFNPKGFIAAQERDLLVTALLLTLVVAMPVVLATFLIAWKYRAGNKKARFTPNWDRSVKLQTSWVGLISIMILVLAIMAWRGSHALDPRKPIESNARPITIQVVALQWKWLFIYPELNIATVNFVQFPQDTPINFEITADAPMNAFWIPQLGGQMYAMNGMKTKLHLMADEAGEYRGFSSNISGEGFAHMSFKAKVTSQADFDAWVRTAKTSTNELSLSEYDQLAKPNPGTQSIYAAVEPDLFDEIIMKFMPASPAGGGHSHVR